MTSPLARVGLPTSDDPAAPRSSRKAVLGVAALGVVGLAVAAQLLLGGGSELDDLGTAPAAAAAPPASAAPPATPTPSPRFPDAEQVREGRDPFAPLYVEPAVTDGSAAPTGAVPATPAPGAVPGAVPGGAAPGGAVPGVEMPVGPTQPAETTTTALALLRVDGPELSRSAVFTVDGSEQVVAVGEGFGPSGALLLLSLQQGPDPGGWTAVVQQDRGDPFDVVTGAVVTLP